MIYTASTKLLALYSEQPVEEVTYLPEKAAYTTFMTLAGTFFDNGVITGCLARFGAHINIADITLVVFVFITVRSQRLSSVLCVRASAAFKSACALSFASGHFCHLPLTTQIVTQC